MKKITLDARNLLCPLPVIRLQQKIAQSMQGDHITAICTDPGALHDIPAWARIHGHNVLQVESVDSEHHITVEIV